MERFRFISKKKMADLPENAGVYVFKDNENVLYIGKTINIKKRIKNHFQRSGFKENLFLNKTNRIGFIKTDSEIEAFLLEAKLIKKFQPKFNVMWKDSKDYFYVAINVGEKYPKIFITHQPLKLQNTKYKLQITNKFKIQNSKFLYIGPFVDGKALKQTLRIMRKIFPFYSVKKHPKGLCPYCHLGLCPGPKPKLMEYRKNIENLIAFFQDRKKAVLNNFKKEMKQAAENRDFEKAAKIRDKIFALENILSHAKIFHLQTEPWNYPWVYGKTKRKLKKLLGAKNNISRIEGYDISNIQGMQATGSMVVFIAGRPEKSLYRKFKIKTIKKPNDIAMLKEVLKRRFNHSEWEYPDVILIDGGKAQLNAALKILEIENSLKIENCKLKIAVLALAKKNNDLYIERRKKPISLKSLPREIYNLILQIRDESHRFAKSYHKKLRNKELTSN